jgi:flagellar motor switch protein FliM
MEKTLNQEEIAALLQVAEGRKTQSAKEPPPDQTVVPCDFRRAGFLTPEQVRAIRSLHDTFARALTNSLGAHLRAALEIALVSVEQMTYAEFLRHIPDLNFAGSVALSPLVALAAVELDLPLALPVIDLLLGGSGGSVSEVRELTEIEEEILGSVVNIICRELEAAWQPVLKLDFRFERRQRQAQLLRLMSPQEKVLSLSLEIHMAEVRGTLNFAFPAVVAKALVRKLDEQGSYRRHTGGPSDSRHLRKVLEECRFHAELLLPEAAVSARKLMHLKVGDVLELPFKVSVPTLFKVENQTLFLAHPVAVGDRRAAEMNTKAGRRQFVEEEPN